MYAMASDIHIKVLNLNTTMKITKISKKGLDLIKSFEGFRSAPYADIVGVNTIGYGNTYYPGGKKVTLQDSPITEEEATKLLLNTLTYYEQSVDSLVRDDISQNKYDSLVSFAYNLGVNALKKSTLLKLVNENPNNHLIKDEFLKWCNAGGRKVSGLVKRRTKEVEHFFSVV